MRCAVVLHCSVLHRDWSADRISRVVKMHIATWRVGTTANAATFRYTPIYECVDDTARGGRFEGRSANPHVLNTRQSHFL